MSDCKNGASDLKVFGILDIIVTRDLEVFGTLDIVVTPDNILLILTSLIQNLLGSAHVLWVYFFKT